MFVLFLIALSIFVCQWRCKNSRQSNIYYIEYEASEPQEMVEIKRKPIVFEMEKEKKEIKKETPKKTEIEKEDRHNVVHREIKEKTVIFREETNVVQRPVTLIIEKEPARPSSQNLSSPLSPRELFFLDMYEYANIAMRNATDNFLQKERLLYDPSGPVQREYSDSSSDIPEIQHEEQYRTDQAVVEQSPVRVPYLLHETSPVSELAPLHSRLSEIIHDQTEIEEPNIVPVIKKTKPKRPKESYIELSPAEVEFPQFGIKVSSPVCESAPVRSRPLKTIPDHPEIEEITIVPVIKKAKAKKPKDREYFIANVVPQEHWTTEAYLFVQDEEKERKPYTIVVDMDGSD
ncbi:unnamed protein product [Diabrotica balteata]|uniref:Uncharacterized protein n=1 Tax=Diabrotica balteata TaxID=107213 RepID=A0A9N9TBU2_DIABA|nr:unnamed protein product [Diabrotica balteata]